MANLNSVLIAIITGSFGMATGIFFILYCLEKPIYNVLFQEQADGSNSYSQMRRVLVVLKQLLSFQVPIVMVTLMISATVGSIVRVVIDGFSPFPILIALSSTFTLLFSGLFVPSAVNTFKNASPEVSPNDLQAALRPIVRLHRNVGIIVAILLILQLTSVALPASNPFGM